MTKVFLLLLLAAIVVQARETVNGAADLEYDRYSDQEEQYEQKDNNADHGVVKPRIPTNSSEGDLKQLPSHLSEIQAIEARETVNGDNNLEYDIESQENEQHSNMYLAKPREQSNGTGGDFDEISEAIERLDLQAENTP
ncbi:uncharacterized protein LOC119167618 isoform X2 [Rhipicephalus microplus]|uniref:uncharacterized protein LOC119167618 isoform X2 n=1 Tax=Rhipicephalus microplus TaxID=6941 RepID=UPI001887EC20|nr:uncharacterized protein LOC119167618 isoform X2 [Rhipicephalus microplus]